MRSQPHASLKKCTVTNYRLQLGKEFNNQYLTKREMEVLKCVVLGYTAKKIGQYLHISFRTVEVYIETIKLKLKCSSKGDIARITITSGLIHQLELL
ncbi:MAG: helix-turn-helix transcriptional regulator [Gammaproteobacteria bacterium]|nr:helix-turn-helix transcriptional regulator [Gammaproteobacteria bacterium]